MTDAEWQSVNLQEALRFVNFAPETRKSDLLTVACARTVWTGLRQRLQKEILAIEAHADNPSIPGANVGTLIEGPAWFKSSASKRIKETEGLLFALLFTTCKDLGDDDLVPLLASHEWSGLLRDIFGNPFRPVSFDPAWRSDAAVGIAAKMYDSRDFGNMPILADALQDAGCNDADILAHCRGDGPHVRGCWVVDQVLGKA